MKRLATSVTAMLMAAFFWQAGASAAGSAANGTAGSTAAGTTGAAYNANAVNSLGTATVPTVPDRFRTYAAPGVNGTTRTLTGDNNLNNAGPDTSNYPRVTNNPRMNATDNGTNANRPYTALNTAADANNTDWGWLGLLGLIGLAGLFGRSRDPEANR